MQNIKTVIGMTNYFKNTDELIDFLAEQNELKVADRKALPRAVDEFIKSTHFSNSAYTKVALDHKDTCIYLATPTGFLEFGDDDFVENNNYETMSPDEWGYKKLTNGDWNLNLTTNPEPLFVIEVTN